MKYNETMNRIFSGIRASGQLHLGNYLGAIKNWIALQNNPDNELVVFGVVDYHAITTPFNPLLFQEQIMDVVLDYLAAGVDPKKALLIRQSHIPQHTELAWIFNTITPVSWLDRLPTYKEKLEQTAGKYNNLGLLAYPVLMAADILVYKSNLVPVGDDQKAHIDITNEIAKKFNSMFGSTFEPVKTLKAEGARIRSIIDPGKKMSKTGDSGIGLSDTTDEIREKIKKAVTDSSSEIKFDPDLKPAISNLMLIHHLLTDDSYEEIADAYRGKSYSHFKEELAEVIISFLRPFQERRAQFADNSDEVLKILRHSEEKARIVAQKTVDEVKEKMGLLNSAA